MFTVYELYSPSFDKTYVGHMSDIASRLRSHNTLAPKGYTIRYRPSMLIYSEVYPTKTEAIKRERELKSGKGRIFIQTIIKQKIE